MKKIRSLPYLTPSSGRIEVSGWNTNLSGNYEQLPHILSTWDAAVSIQAETVVTIDVRGVFDDCHLNDYAVLRLAAVWESKGSGLIGRSTSHDFTYSDQKHSMSLAVNIEGVNLAKQIDLVVLVVLVHPGDQPQAFAPKLVGSILFKEVHPIQLEGEGSRFPTEVIDFRETHYPNDAAWFLEWNPLDLEQTVLGDIRLYINGFHNRIKDAVSSTGEQGFEIREMIRFDVARTLIYGALRNQHFVDDPEQYDDETVGAAVYNMLQLFFPTDTILDLKSRSEQPQLFEPQLQAKLRIFWEDDNG